MGATRRRSVRRGDAVSESGDILDNVQRLIVELQSHPDASVGARLSELLQGIDTVHRTALTHLVGAIHSMAGEAFINRLTSDPAIRLLLMSYDLISVDRRLHAEEALDTVRGHLHDHGIDVELADVAGGAVYVTLHGLERSGVAPDAVCHDLEEALKAGLVGFQELVLGDRSPQLIQIGGLRPVQRPVYRRAGATAELAPGAVKAIDIDGHSILLANVNGDIHAVANRCGDSPLPLQFSTLTGAELRCSWHGCRYDVRTGQRLDGPERLAVFPVSVQGADIRVAVGVQTVPQD